MSADKHLSALDSTFLELEQADSSAHMHIGSLMVFEGAPPSRAEVVALLEQRLGALPHPDERLSHPHVNGLRFPAWERDPDFSVDRHVARAALPSPGSDEELLAWAGDFYSHRLDRRRPLWELVLLEGLDNGRWAFATKTHHCLVDGVGATDSSQALLDGGTGIPVPAAHAATDGHGTIDALAGAALHPLETLQRSAAVAELLVRDELLAAPHTSLNVPIGEHRRLVVTRAPLDDLRAVKQALGGKINDVVLTCVAGGLRELLLARGEPLPEAGLRVMVPVNARPSDDRSVDGNSVTSLFVPLDVAEADPVARYRRIRRASAREKDGSGAKAATALIELGALAHPVMHAVVARSTFATRLFNLTVTNVPGPRMRLSAFGSPMLEVIPLVPLAAQHAVGVAIVSYEGNVVFCANCDRDSVPDAAVLADGIASTLAQLRERAGAAAVA